MKAAFRIEFLAWEYDHLTMSIGTKHHYLELRLLVSDEIYDQINGSFSLFNSFNVTNSMMRQHLSYEVRKKEYEASL